MTKTYTSAYLMEKDLAKMKREGWVVRVMIKQPDGSFEVKFTRKV